MEAISSSLSLAQGFSNLGFDVQLRELADNVDIMDLEIDRESILLYCLQTEVLSFPIPPLVMDFFARCGVSPLMINPCVLILLLAFAATNLALKGSHFLSFLCLGGGYIVFPLGLARLSSNDEINEDARKILDLYVAGEDENPDIPLPDGIPID
ncbi:hypothetical protein CUMW_227060 [Citrus unshiu]|uniref:Uncharacterized protein n=1 Tax=Citrus unshiu TaxID=55188 RepID=A0A2H5QG69_CITUN|nr:hypothetical protein CUMW_227060 [Citrus unshiu]